MGVRSHSKHLTFIQRFESWALTAKSVVNHKSKDGAAADDGEQLKSRQPEFQKKDVNTFKKDELVFEAYLK